MGVLARIVLGVPAPEGAAGKIWVVHVSRVKSALTCVDCRGIYDRLEGGSGLAASLHYDVELIPLIVQATDHCSYMSCPRIQADQRALICFAAVFDFGQPL